ncbi:MAG: autotransporter-associated beta strand repeat-containing protein [Verrucomicrobia bacterium]|nr:autotransporter-associated beta strand repeat-containing protein [Verrucomicrobiota bacterium]
MQSRGVIAKLNTLVASATGAVARVKAARFGSAVLLGVLVALAPSVRAASRTWSNSGTDFATAANWGGTVPANNTTADTGNFTSTATQNPNLAGNRSINGLNFSSTAGAYTLTANSNVFLTLGNQGVVTASGNTQTFSTMNLALGNATVAFTVSGAGNLVINSAVNTGTGNVAVLGGTGSGSGSIGGVVSGTGNITKTGTGTWTLSGNNTYTGQTQIQNGTLSVNTLANAGTNSAIGAATGTNATIKIGSTTTTGTLQYTGAGSTTNRAIDLAGTTGGATLDASGTGAVTFSNTSVTASGAGSKTLTLTGNNTGTNTLSGNIVNNSGTNLTSLVKSGNGTWVLGGTASSFTGQVQIQQGTLSVSTLANGGTNSNLGAATGANGTIKIGSGANTGTLRYTGAGSTTNRAIDLAGTTGGATLDASGTGNITFSNTSVTASGVGAKTLTLTGTNTGNNTLAGAVVDSSSGATSLVKSGAGNWVLSGTSTYTGGTTVNAGTLTIGGSGGATGTIRGNLTANSGTTVNVTATDAFGYTAGAKVDTVVLNNATLNTITSDANGNQGWGIDYTLNNGSTLSSNGGVSSTTANSKFAFGGDAGDQTTVRVSGTGTSVIAGRVDLRTDSGQTNVNVTVDSGSALNVTAGITGGAGFTKLGAGNMTLSGNNSYTGNTTISAGTLQVGNGGTSGTLGSGGAVINNAALVFNRSDALAVSNTISGTGTVTQSGTGTTTLSAVNTFTGGVVVNNGTLAGTGTTSTGGFTAFGNYSGIVTPTNVITVNNGGSLAVSSTDTSGYGNGNTTALQNLVLNGAGYNGTGALVANGGTNTWTGNISLGSNATITNNGASGDANLLFLGPYVANPPVNFALNNNTVTFNGTGDIYLTESMGAYSGTDTGSVIINGGTANTTVYYAGIKSTYTGDTTVNSGILELLVPPGNNPNSAILGNLTIGDGTGVGAKVIDYYSDQIKDTATVTINSDGTLDLGTFSRSEDIGKLILNGGTVSTGTGLLYLANVASGPNISVTGTNLTSTISGVMWLQGSTGSLTTRTIDVAATDTLNLTANVFGGNLVKTGNGTMMMNFNNAANGYTGTTSVQAGILNIQNGGALGATGSNSAAYGTTVSSNATLQLQGGIAVGTEALTLNGSGFGGTLGALESKSGSNSWAGGITLGSNSTINSDSGSTLAINGTVTGTATTGTQVLTAGGAGNTTYAGAISDGSGGGSLSLTKADAGTVTITGSNTFTGAVAVNAGTLVVGANATLGNQANAVSVASGATINFKTGADASHVFVNSMSALTGSGTVSVGTYAKAILNVASTDTFDGLISGTGTFNLNGDSSKTGTLTLTNGATNFAGTLAIDRGELDFSHSASGSTFANVTIGNSSTVTTLKLNNANITFGTLTINGDTVLDFGNSGASILNTTNIYIAAGATLTVKNWDSEVDFLYASTHFSQIGGTDATKNQIGTTPENQVKFYNTFDANGAYTTWTDNSYYGDANGPYQNRQIRPVPEPATYGAIFMAAALGFLGYRQYRRRKAA